VNTDSQTRQNNRQTWPILPILLGLDAFVLGGLAALLAVNRLLQRHAVVYEPHNMDATSVVLDLMDDLLGYLLPSIALLAFLVLVTIAVGVWLKAKSRTVRHTATALVLTVLLVYAAGVGHYVFKTTELPSIPPMTPTPTLIEGLF
jgi:hypothetical protein